MLILYHNVWRSEWCAADVSVQYMRYRPIELGWSYTAVPSNITGSSQQYLRIYHDRPYCDGGRERLRNARIFCAAAGTCHPFGSHVPARRALRLLGSMWQTFVRTPAIYLDCRVVVKSGNDKITPCVNAPYSAHYTIMSRRSPSSIKVYCIGGSTCMLSL